MEAAEISQFSICSRCILFCEAVLEPALEPTSRADFEAQLDWGASLGDAKACWSGVCWTGEELGLCALAVTIHRRRTDSEIFAVC